MLITNHCWGLRSPSTLRPADVFFSIHFYPVHACARRPSLLSSTPLWAPLNNTSIYARFAASFHKCFLTLSFKLQTCVWCYKMNSNWPHPIPLVTLSFDNEQCCFHVYTIRRPMSLMKWRVGNIIGFKDGCQKHPANCCSLVRGQKSHHAHCERLAFYNEWPTSSSKRKVPS